MCWSPVRPGSLADPFHRPLPFCTLDKLVREALEMREPRLVGKAEAGQVEPLVGLEGGCQWTSGPRVIGTQRREGG